MRCLPASGPLRGTAGLGGVRDFSLIYGEGAPSGAVALFPHWGKKVTSPISLIRATLIRVRIEPGFIHSGSNRSPNRASFKNKPEYALFLQSEELKRSRKRVLLADLMPNGYLIDTGKRGRKRAAMARLWALYGAQIGLIFTNRAI